MYRCWWKRCSRGSRRAVRPPSSTAPLVGAGIRGRFSPGLARPVGWWRSIATRTRSRRDAASATRASRWCIRVSMTCEASARSAISPAASTACSSTSEFLLHSLRTPPGDSRFAPRGLSTCGMDPGDGESLGAWLERVSERELAGVIARYGEERHARRIAGAIVRARPIGTTTDLAAVVERAALSREAAIHPATRTFPGASHPCESGNRVPRGGPARRGGRSAAGRTPRRHQLPLPRGSRGQALSAGGVESGAGTPRPSPLAAAPSEDGGRPGAAING